MVSVDVNIESARRKCQELYVIRSSTYGGMACHFRSVAVNGRLGKTLTSTEECSTFGNTTPNSNGFHRNCCVTNAVGSLGGCKGRGIGGVISIACINQLDLLKPWKNHLIPLKAVSQLEACVKVIALLLLSFYFVSLPFHLLVSSNLSIQ